jgi:hypothetical protein
LVGDLTLSSGSQEVMKVSGQEEIRKLEERAK